MTYILQIVGFMDLDSETLPGSTITLMPDAIPQTVDDVAREIQSKIGSPAPQIQST